MKKNLYNYISSKILLTFLILVLVIDIFFFFIINHITTNMANNYSESAIIAIKNIISEKNKKEYITEKNYGDFLIKELTKIKKLLNIDTSSPEIIIKNEIESASLFNEFGMKTLDYYLINKQGLIYATSYATDLNLNFKEFNNSFYWNFLSNMQTGDIFTSPYTFEIKTGELRKYAFLKLKNGNIIELGLKLDKEIFSKMYEEIPYIKDNLEFLKELGIYYLPLKYNSKDMQPLFGIYKKPTVKENSLMLKSLERNSKETIVSGNTATICIPWNRYSEKQSKLSEKYVIKIVIDISDSINMEKIALLVLNIFLIIIFIIYLFIVKKITKDITDPFTALLFSMRSFAQSKVLYKDKMLEDNKIEEIDLLFTEYVSMTDELSFTIQEYNKTLKSLESAYEEIDKAHNYFISLLVDIVEGYDENTGNHVERVGKLSGFIAKKLNLSETMINNISKYAPLHDIGKISIPQSILLKPGKLEIDEWETMKTHTLAGAAILGNEPIFNLAKNITLYHHEKFNGNGYPFGLKGDEIPMEAAIVSFVDVYDALRSRRNYKEAFSHSETFEIITKGDGRTIPDDFHPDILKIFINHQKEIEMLWNNCNQNN